MALYRSLHLIFGDRKINRHRGNSHRFKCWLSLLGSQIVYLVFFFYIPRKQEVFFCVFVSIFFFQLYHILTSFSASGVKNPDLSTKRVLVAFQIVHKCEIMCVYLTDILLYIFEFMHIFMGYNQKHSEKKKFSLKRNLCWVFIHCHF